MFVSRANPRDFGRRLYERRRQLGLTRRQLAERVGVSPGFIGYIEGHAASGVRSDLFTRLAAALGVPAVYLLGPGLSLSADSSPRTTASVVNRARSVVAGTQ